MKDTARSINESISNGEFPPLIYPFREKEVQTAISHLENRDVNILMIVGNQGAGKQALVQLLTKKLIEGDTQTSIQGATIFLIPSEILAEDEANLKYLRGNIFNHAGKVERAYSQPILYTPDIQRLAQMGADPHELGLWLSQTQDKWIVTIENDAYYKYFNNCAPWNNAPLFQPLDLSELSEAETEEILRERQHWFENEEYDLQINPSAISATLEYCEKYLKSSIRPGIQIEILEEACRFAAKK